MANQVQVALIDSAGDIVIKSGGVGSGANMRSPLQVVAVYVLYEDTPGNEVMVRHKGVDALSCEDTGDGTSLIYERITGGGSRGAKVFEYAAIGTPTNRELETGTEDVAASASACWDVYAGGQGGQYASALADADAAAGYTLGI